MPKNANDADSKKTKQEYRYWRVTITYSDNEISGRVFKDRDKAEKYAARQKKAPVVKKAVVESIVRPRFRPSASKHSKTT
jgi:hypothetical protein